MTTPNREQVGQVVLNTILRTKNPPNSGLLALEVADAILAQVGSTEWGIIQKETTDPDVDDWEWRRLDDGSGWSNRRGQKYTEKEVREQMTHRINGLEPGEYRRIVKRHVTDWEVEQS